MPTSPPPPLSETLAKQIKPVTAMTLIQHDGEHYAVRIQVTEPGSRYTHGFNSWVDGHYCGWSSGIERVRSAVQGYILLASTYEATP